MRLIDADKIGEVSADPYEEGAFQDEIRSQPTVNAIPWQALVELMRHQPHDIGKSQYTALVKKWLMENDEDFRKYMEEQEYWEKQSSRFD